MISSLLNLQGNELKGHPAEAAIAAGKFRVEALALIHQKLYQEDVHATIQLKDYIEELVLNLCYSFNNNITPTLQIEDVAANIDQAIPLALIVNELVTNALKYAFKKTAQPELIISLETTKQHLILSIEDNGVGFTPDTHENTNSFGIKLVNSLVTQLKGQLTSANDHGSLWTVKVPNGDT